MVVYRKLTETDGETAVALGMFDGVHRGHREVIDRVAAQKQNGFIPTVLTFSTDHAQPARKRGTKKILTESLFFEVLESAGIDLVEIPPFEVIRELTPREFTEQVLSGILHAKAVVCGRDFRFGKNAAGDLTVLRKLCAELGIRVEDAPPLMEDGETVSSTRIRQCLLDGEIETANCLLGYPYSFNFEVAHGNELGRTVGFPTINQIFPEQYLVPRYGVYASYTYLEGKRYKSITNVGVKPTIKGNRHPLAETHIMGVDDHLYGQHIKVSLMKFIRPEKKFDSFEELSAEVHANIELIGSLLD